MSRSPVVLALLHPLNLTMLALTVAAGLCSAWWLAPLGLLFWLAMVIVIARDPGLKITFTRTSRQPLAQRFQTRFDRLDRARVSIFNALQKADPPLRKAAEPVQLALDDLVDHAYQLGLRMTALDNNYSVQRISTNFDEDKAQMQKNIRETQSPADRKEFEQALQSLQERQSQLKETGTLMARFEAQLTGTNNAVDNVVTGVVGLRGRTVEHTNEKIPALLKIIQTEEAEFKAFDSQLENFSGA